MIISTDRLLMEEATGTPTLHRLIGDESRNFCGSDGSPIYRRGSIERLSRVGATDGCIYCGLPDGPGWLTDAHIHTEDIDLSPYFDPTRVFRLCWFHHHGCYDQGLISTIDLLECELIWLTNENRPKPNGRDIELMRRFEAGEIVRDSRWQKPSLERLPVFYPHSLGFGFFVPPARVSDANMLQSCVTSLMRNATEWKRRATEADTASREQACMARATEYLHRAKRVEQRLRRLSQGQKNYRE